MGIIIVHSKANNNYKNNNMAEIDNKHRSYMALAPLSALAAIFINPLACTIIPLILFFIFRSSRPKVAEVALRTADLAFSIQLWMMLISLFLLLGISVDFITPQEAKEITSTATLVVILLFIASLLIATYKAIKGQSYSHIFSFKIAEKVLKLTSKAAKDNNNGL